MKYTLIIMWLVNVQNYNNIKCDDWSFQDDVIIFKNSFNTWTVGWDLLDRFKTVEFIGYNSFLDEEIKNYDNFSCDKDGFKYNKNLPKISEYAKEYKLSINKQIEKIEKFEKINEKYLNIKEGKIKYEIAKKIVKKKEVNFNKFSNNNIFQD